MIKAGPTVMNDGTVSGETGCNLDSKGKEEWNWAAARRPLMRGACSLARERRQAGGNEKGREGHPYPGRPRNFCRADGFLRRHQNMFGGIVGFFRNGSALDGCAEIRRLERNVHDQISRNR